MSGGRLTGSVVPDVLNAMTVDVEDWFQVQAFAGVIERREWHRLEYRAVENTHRLLDLFSQHGIKATFFVLGWIAERSPALIRDIQSMGHEIACHGWSHQLVYNQAPAEFREETIRAKSLLEDLTAKPVLGYRAASYSITGRSLWALDTLIDAGFSYDSSIFPVRHDTYGIRDASVLPGVYAAPSGRRIIEFPLTTWTVGSMRIPIAGGGYFRLLPYWVVRRGLQAVNSIGVPAIFYLHPWEIDPEQPRVRASLRSRFRHYQGLRGTFRNLNRLCGEFRFSTAINVLAGCGLLNA